MSAVKKPTTAEMASALLQAEEEEEEREVVIKNSKLKKKHVEAPKGKITPSKIPAKKGIATSSVTTPEVPKRKTKSVAPAKSESSSVAKPASISTALVVSKQGLFHLVSRSLGPKTSEAYVKDLEEGFEKAKVTPQEKVVLIQAFKTLPTTSAAERVLKESLKKSIAAQKSFGVTEKDAKQSKPYVASLKTGTEAVAIINRVLRHLDVPAAFTWGTFAQLPDIQETFECIKKELEVSNTIYQSYFYKKFIPSLAEFNWVFENWFFRIACLGKLTSILKREGLIHFTAAAPEGPGYVASDASKLKKTLEKNPDLSQGIHADMATLTAGDGLEEALLCYQWAMAPDIRQCAMAKDIRQTRVTGHKEQIRMIAGGMEFVIKLLIKNPPKHPASLDTDSDFCKLYYECRSILARSKRNYDRVLGTTSTGANTRKDDLGVVIDVYDFSTALGGIGSMDIKLTKKPTSEVRPRTDKKAEVEVSTKALNLARLSLKKKEKEVEEEASEEEEEEEEDDADTGGDEDEEEGEELEGKFQEPSDEEESIDE